MSKPNGYNSLKSLTQQITKYGNIKFKSLKFIFLPNQFDSPKNSIVIAFKVHILLYPNLYYMYNVHSDQ